MQRTLQCPPLMEDRREEDLYQLLRSRRLTPNSPPRSDQAGHERSPAELHPAGYQHQHKHVHRGHHHQPRTCQRGQSGSREQPYQAGQQRHTEDEPGFLGQYHQQNRYQPGQQGHRGRLQSGRRAQPVPYPSQHHFQSRTRQTAQFDQTGQYRQPGPDQPLPEQADQQAQPEPYQRQAQQADLWSYHPGTSYNLEPQDSEQPFYRRGPPPPSSQPTGAQEEYCLYQPRPQVSWRSGTSAYRQLPAQQALGCEPFLSELVRQQKETSRSSGLSMLPQAQTQPFPTAFFQNRYMYLPGINQPLVYSLLHTPLSQDDLQYQNAVQNTMYQGQTVVTVKPPVVGDDQTVQVLHQTPVNIAPQMIMTSVPQLQPYWVPVVHSHTPQCRHHHRAFEQSANALPAVSAQLPETQRPQQPRAANRPQPDQAEPPEAMDAQDVVLFPTPHNTRPEGAHSSSHLSRTSPAQVQSALYQTPVASDAEDEAGGATVRLPASGIRSIRQDSNGVISISVSSLSAVRFQTQPVTVSANDVAEDLQSFDYSALQEYIQSMDTADLVRWLESLDSPEFEENESPAPRVQTERYTSVHVYTFPQTAEGENLSEEVEETSNTTKEECPICLERYTSGVQVAVLPCSSPHHFHADCLRTWLRQSSTCPYCRNVLPSYRRLRRV